MTAGRLASTARSTSTPSRFQELGGGTFWLEEPADLPPSTTVLGPKRICTWVRLRDSRSGRCLRVYNLHHYLTESARVGAVRLILDRIASGDPTDAVLVAGDFNATPDAPDRRLFDESGLVSSGKLAGASPDTPTYQFYGIRTRSLDEILINRGWRVVQHRVLDVKPGNTFPSDHFGVMADLVLRDEATSSGSILEGKDEAVSARCPKPWKRGGLLALILQGKIRGQGLAAGDRRYRLQDTGIDRLTYEADRAVGERDIHAGSMHAAAELAPGADVR